MKLSKKTGIKQSILVIITSLTVGFLSILRVLIGATKIPQGSVYLAVGHYYADYFEYVQMIVQGMRGHWLVDNPFTPNDSTRTFLGWGQYLILGRLANLFHWSPYFVYWFSVFVVSIILSWLYFQLIKRLLPKESFFLQFSAWLMTLFAAPLIIVSNTSGLTVYPYDFWYAPMSFFARFEGIPHQLLSTLLVALLLLFIGNLLTNIKQTPRLPLIYKSVIISFLLIFLLTSAPFQVINIMSSLLITVWIYINIFLYKNSKKEIFKVIFFLGITSILLFPAALFIRQSFNSSALFQRQIVWDTSAQSYYGIWTILATTGPILLFIPFGLRAFFQSISPTKLLVFFYTIFCYVYMQTPLSLYFGAHNMRFLSPVAYVIFAVLTVIGIRTVSQWFPKKRIVLILLTTMLIGYFVIVTDIIYKTYNRTVPPLHPLSYLPKDLITGIKTLDNIHDNKAILTSPRLSLGLIVPVVTDKKVYLGRIIFTPDFELRNNLAEQIYLNQLPVDQTLKLIRENNIGYAVLSKQEGYHQEDIEKYPFLKKIFENSEVVIYKVN